ncbi:hypothetical protein Ms3S1_18370 [Methylosinus sp. 3S-1]
MLRLLGEGRIASPAQRALRRSTRYGAVLALARLRRRSFSPAQAAEKRDGACGLASKDAPAELLLERREASEIIAALATQVRRDPLRAENRIAPLLPPLLD